MNQNNIIFHSLKIKSFAEKVFQTLDSRLNPKVFAFTIEKTEDKENIFFEPQENDNNCKKIYRSIKKEIQESSLNLFEILSDLELHSFLKDFFINYDSNNKTSSFVSNIFSEEKFYLAIILQIDKEKYNGYPFISTIDKSSAPKKISLIDLAIDRFITISLNYFLHLVHKLGAIAEGYDIEKQVITWSANVLMDVVNEKVKSFDDKSNSLINKNHNLFENCNAISSLMYEGKECRGNLFISAKNNGNIDILQTLKEPIYIDNHRVIRKLMEITSGDKYLLYCNGFIYGIGKLKGKYNLKKENLFQVRFDGHYKWKLFHKDLELMSVSYGNAKAYDDVIDFEKAKKTFKAVFPKISNSIINKVFNFIEFVSLKKHGTILVILKKAEEEALRLKNQAIIFEPFVLNSANIVDITNIDGAVILDMDFKCHAAGVILDGIATGSGSSARGARYNSAVRYINSQKDGALAVVISDDGMVDIVI